VRGNGERLIKMPSGKGSKKSSYDKLKLGYGKKRTALKIILVVLILGVLAILIFSLSSTPKKYFSPFDKSSSSKLAYGKGISFVEYHGDKKVYSVSIDTFSIERERLGPFAIGPLRIAHLKNVKVDLYLDEIESKSNGRKVISTNPLPSEERTEVKEERGGGLNFESPILSMKRNLPPEIKKVRGLKLKNISFNLWRQEQKIFTISSDSANIDRETGDIIFIGHATMDAGENGKLVSYRIRWIKKTYLFRVTDPYYLIKDGKRIEGKGIETDYLFKKIKNLDTY